MTSYLNKAGVNIAGFNWQKGGNSFGLGDLGASTLCCTYTDSLWFGVCSSDGPLKFLLQLVL